MMDVISWKNFWFEFEQAYVTLEAGEVPSTRVPAVSFKTWTHTLEKIANAVTTVTNVKEWLRQDWPAVTEIPKDFNNDWTANINSSVDVVTFALSEGETQALLRIGTYGVDLQTALVGALSAALSKWQKNRVVFFDRLVHGRNVALPGCELSRTIGCLVSYAPTLITLDSALPTGAQILDIARQIEIMDELGTSIELFKYHGKDEKTLIRTRELPEAKVMLNYRGHIDAVFDKSSLFRQAYHFSNLDHNPNGLRRYPIAVSVDLAERRLAVKWVFSTRLHRKETIEGLSHEFSKFMTSIINHELTPEER
jgi:hypothetical protein